jgi:hypothetical protein
MSADVFLVCYEIRWDINASDEDQIHALEMREDPRIRAARENGMNFWWGRTVEENRYSLLVGKMIGRFGWENEREVQLEDEAVFHIIEETKRKLGVAGFEETPALHCLFEPDF